MNFIQFITTRRFLKHFGASVIITIALAWIILSLLKQYTLHGKTVVVPSFIGMDLNTLDKMETVKDFDILVVDSVFDYSKKGGIVVFQDPLPKSSVKPGRTIYLSVTSFSPEQTKVPALVDLSLRQAKALLQTYGLKLGFISVIPDPAKNAVIRASCNGRTLQTGALISKGSIIDLFVGSGIGGDNIAIPFLIGKSRTEAISEIASLGFELGSENFDIHSDTLNARVFMQNPMFVFGKSIPPGTSIDLEYRSDDSFDFESYIRTLEIDTLVSDSIPQ
jgi:beta-lactam-binding protein with PASTA domain